MKPVSYQIHQHKTDRLTPDVLMMAAVTTSETFVNFYETGSYIHTRHCEKVKLHLKTVYFLK
jgi:hypothetical protein